MSAHPDMVSGEGRNDLILMRAGHGDWVTKVGAEGVQAIGVRSRGWGIALKVVDGNARGLHPATVATLDLLGLLDAPQRAALASWREPTIRNYRGLMTGQRAAGACGWSALGVASAGPKTLPARLNFPVGRRSRAAGIVPRGCHECPAGVGYTPSGCRAHLTGCGENNEMTPGAARGWVTAKLISSSWSVRSVATSVPSSCWC